MSDPGYWERVELHNIVAELEDRIAFLEARVESLEKKG